MMTAARATPVRPCCCSLLLLPPPCRVAEASGGGRGGADCSTHVRDRLAGSVRLCPRASQVEESVTLQPGCSLPSTHVHWPHTRLLSQLSPGSTWVCVKNGNVALPLWAKMVEPMSEWEGSDRLPCWGTSHSAQMGVHSSALQHLGCRNMLSQQVSFLHTRVLHSLKWVVAQNSEESSRVPSGQPPVLHPVSKHLSGSGTVSGGRAEMYPSGQLCGTSERHSSVVHLVYSTGPIQGLVQLAG
mmetsp:Transcript_34418/g.76470  ORF Transcript_34418/g.76470 Transcript_34418/m.76470 type:complete len:242 (+) Transcript_34418:827-1552(+)